MARPCLLSRSIQTYLPQSITKKVKCCTVHTDEEHMSLAFWDWEKETAMRTDAALTVLIETPPGKKDTPEETRVTVVLVVYMLQMLHTFANEFTARGLLTTPRCPPRTSPAAPRANPLPAPETPHICARCHILSLRKARSYSSGSASISFAAYTRRTSVWNI